MRKRILALVLCLVILGGVLAGCRGLSGDDKGAYIPMYLTDEIYDFDPANAYHNTDAVNVLSLLYETLFTLTSNGKIKPSLAKSYKFFSDDDGIHMEITLRPTYWSNGTYALTANDCIYSWRRLLNPTNKFAAASLLFDIKNARAFNQGIMSEDSLMVEAVEQQVIRITFENNINVNDFLLNLTNVATAPLLKATIGNNPDWAKKASTLVTSGPFKLGKIKYAEALNERGKNITVNDDYALDENGAQRTDASGIYNVQKISSFTLERNAYYYRDTKRDSLDKYVTPYRILVDCTMTDEKLLEEYQNKHLFYLGSIPLSLRNDEYVIKHVKVTNALSTFVAYLNENAVINGQNLFADAHVRRALSLVLDREAIAEAIVYADAATALVGNGIYEKGTSGSFRKTGGDLIATTANLAAAQAELSQAGISAAKYSFTLKVASYDEVHIAMAKMIAEAWNQLGFHVTVQTMETIQNNDIRKEGGIAQEKPSTDVCDDLFAEALQRGDFEAIVLDYNAYTPSAYAMLSNFALGFSGSSTMDANHEYTRNTHITGYNSADYNSLMEAIYFIPYYTKMEANPDPKLFESNDPDPTRNPNPYLGFGIETYEDYISTYNAITKIYETYGITPTEKTGKWAAQKATLLHAAEEMLLNDMPVIPIVFNKNATLTNTKYLSGIKRNYYVPALFTKTKLKNYAKYTYVFYKFPNFVDWDNFGAKEEPKIAS